MTVGQRLAVVVAVAVAVVVAVAANTDVLTPMTAITMLILAVQYWSQPPLTRKFLNGRVNK